MSDDQPNPAAPPLLRVVRGDPTAEELAALVAVVSATAAAGGGPDAPEQVLSEWATPQRMARTPIYPGPAMSWWASSLPR